VHRDLKAENILVDDNGNVKLIDFGFATICQKGAKLDTLFCGTQMYMSPDLQQQKAYNGQAADVWALGCILFFMLTGKVPFYSPDEQELANLVIRGKYKLEVPRTILSQGIQTLVAKMLEKNGSRRISAAEVLADPWLGQYRKVLRG
jgi:serine/threonine protein kinase